MEMMRNLRHVNIDHLHVGWYQSTLFGSFISRAFVDSQFNYQHSIEESVVLIYGKELQIMLKFHTFCHFHNHDEIATALSLYWNAIQGVKIVVYISL